MKRILVPRLRAIQRPSPTFRSRPSFFSTSSRKPFEIVSASEIQFGQPLHETHPHIIAPGHLTPGISALEYHHRRAALARKLPRNSVAILASANTKFRSGAVFYEFHQDPNFFYLTGFNEPDAVAVIEKGQSDVEYTFHLYVRPKDERAELWDGARSGVQAAQDVFNADEAGDIENIGSVMPEILASAKEVYTDIGGSAKKPSAFSRFLAGNSQPKVDGLAKLLQAASVRPLRPVLNELRLKKSEAELGCMRRAGSVSGSVITEAMKGTPTSEKQLWADLAYGFRSNGLDGEAYVPVIAGGKNALSIHYVRNDALLQDDEVVLVDAGGEYGGYITDITRTWPVNGRFTDAQRDMYNMILNVQKSCVALCHEDANMTLDKLHRISENGLRDGLKSLGFDVTGDAMDKLFPHHVGHYIGLDVHDAPGHSRNERLRQNHCITIEPGVYVSNEERWPAHFRGLGIRIEDSVVIGETSPEVLTRTAIKEADAIEALRR
ncbi:Intermediate cleaving peptidase 55 [Pseudocercospora fuligena]|uniref:Xaa-Pro aminopeptidase n=1 Tax=Pseudocercospora fuligena TaxID=685502 RepID=A0A8H6R620_9PEZI|nr:Intermediate cleaving peptidase 55 [Pseudocercospora fuligena]